MSLRGNDTIGPPGEQVFSTYNTDTGLPGGGLPWLKGPHRGPVTSPTMGQSDPTVLDYTNPSPVTPYPNSVAPNAPGVGADGLMGILSRLSPRDLASIVSAIAGVGGALSGNNQNYNPSTATTDPNLQALIARQTKRMDMADPLYESILKMAGGLMPTQYQPSGIGASSPYVTPPAYGGGQGAGLPGSGMNPDENKRGA